MKALVVILSTIMLLVGLGLGVWSEANGHTSLFLMAIIPLVIGGVIGMIVFLFQEFEE